MSDKLIKFEKSAHWYSKSGEPKHEADLREARKHILFPSITSMEKDVFPNPGLERYKMNALIRAVLDNPKQAHEDDEHYANRVYDISRQKAVDAADFGKRLHKAFQEYPKEPEVAMLPWFDQFRNWIESNRVELLSREKVVVSEELGLAGCYDLFCTINGTPAMVDFKTQDVKVGKTGKKKPEFYDSWLRQLAFYWYANASGKIATKPSNPNCLSIVIDSNHGGLLYFKQWDPREVEEAFEQVVAGVFIWCSRRNFWPTGRRSYTLMRVKSSGSPVPDWALEVPLAPAEMDEVMTLVPPPPVPLATAGAGDPAGGNQPQPATPSPSQMAAIQAAIAQAQAQTNQDNF